MKNTPEYGFSLTRIFLYEDRICVSAQIYSTKIKFFIKNFFSKCDQICRFRRIWSHLLKKYSLENFIFCAVIPENAGQRKPIFCHILCNVSSDDFDVFHLFNFYWDFKVRVGLNVIFFSISVLYAIYFSYILSNISLENNLNIGIIPAKIIYNKIFVR